MRLGGNTIFDSLDVKIIKLLTRLLLRFIQLTELKFCYDL